jgi:hypothetical protein
MDKPRRRIEAKLTISADDWDAFCGALKSIRRDISIHGALSKSSVSGGYDRGWIIECSERPEITHDSWLADLDAYLAAIKAEATNE